MSTSPKIDIARALKKRGMTQAELARKAGLTRSEVSRFATGERLPTLTVLLTIARALDVGLADLVRGR